MQSAGADASACLVMAEAAEAQLVACVRQSLDAFLHQNAIFMCERLYAEFHTEVRNINASWKVSKDMHDDSSMSFYSCLYYLLTSLLSLRTRG